MAKSEEKTDISKLSFEEAIKTLTEIVTKIEQGQIPLEQSLDQYEKGMGLIRHCRGILQEAEKRIDNITRQQATDGGKKE
jgi:exodeoxyribonuclease VII small subunit